MVKVLDLEEVRKLECYMGMKDYIDEWFYNRRGGYFKKYKSHSFVFTVQYVFDEAVGIIGVECCKSADMFYISPLYVKKDYRNERIGYMLVNKMIEVSKKLEYSQVWLKCSNDLVKFYEKLGFIKRDDKMIYYNK